MQKVGSSANNERQTDTGQQSFARNDYGGLPYNQLKVLSLSPCWECRRDHHVRLARDSIFSQVYSMLAELEISFPGREEDNVDFRPRNQVQKLSTTHRP